MSPSYHYINADIDRLMSVPIDCLPSTCEQRTFVHALCTHTCTRNNFSFSPNGSPLKFLHFSPSNFMHRRFRIIPLFSSDPPAPSSPWTTMLHPVPNKSGELRRWLLLRSGGRRMVTKASTNRIFSAFHFFPDLQQKSREKLCYKRMKIITLTFLLYPRCRSFTRLLFSNF